MNKLSIVIVALAALIARISSDCVADPVGAPSNLAGGFSDVQIDDNIRQVALKSSVLWNKQVSGSPSFFKITCLKKAQSQVVSGMMYNITATISETMCDKSQFSSSNMLTQSSVDACNLKSGGASYNCWFKIWVQSWRDRFSLEESNCAPV